MGLRRYGQPAARVARALESTRVSGDHTMRFWLAVMLAGLAGLQLSCQSVSDFESITAPPLEPGLVETAASSDKVSVCHLMGGASRARVRLIRIAASAVEAHLSHGDYLAPTFFRDADGDGYGDPLVTAEPRGDCTGPEGYVEQDSDCDDSDPEVHPAADDDCDGADNDCDGSVDEDCGADPECAGTSCGSFAKCNLGGSCGTRGVCGTTAEGGGLCVDGRARCTSLLRCVVTEECPAGSACLVGSCCGAGVCMPPSLWCSDAPEGAVASALSAAGGPSFDGLD